MTVVIHQVRHVVEIESNWYHPIFLTLFLASKALDCQHLSHSLAAFHFPFFLFLRAVLLGGVLGSGSQGRNQ